MQEENLSHEESMQLITKMIKQGKNYYYESGFGSLLWGFTNLIAFVLAWLEVEMKFRFPVTPFVLLLVALVIQLYYDRQSSHKRKAWTYTEEALHYIWVTFGIAISLLTIVGGIANIGYVTLPMLLILFGMPTFATGCITKFTAMTLGGIFCWICAIVAFLYQGYYAFLLCAASATASWIIPGFMLRMDFIKQKKAEVKQQNGI